MAPYVVPTAHVTVGFIDHSNEASACGFDVATFEGETDVDARITGIELVITAIRALTLCNPGNMGILAYSKNYNMGVPTAKWAQREHALQVGYHDTVTGSKYRMSIPGVDWDALAGDGDWVDYNNLLWTAFKVAFEAGAKSSQGNPIVIDYGRFVGRRS